jgi:hypothetical protein
MMVIENTAINPLYIASGTTINDKEIYDKQHEEPPYYRN